ncbi:7-cyano-7-deazaguanine synthase [Thiotrichales bacterium 19S3-7]|nr:7-cyano-7-deazaguanine synthase [Thiotrichales bacterium 19S3-7]MCF6802739.1 7-cyano-7-deazaguanine synthase [Thiotrichales bacterium 19S3-11]
MKYAVLSLSGGMDSSSLLVHLLACNYQVMAISFNYGQKHKIEIEKAESLCQYLKEQGFLLKHQIISLDGLAELLDSNLVSGGEDVPEGHYHEDNMKLTVVPNRNKIFSSIIQAVALSISQKNHSSCDIAMGIHTGDHATYPDTREAFRELDYQAFLSGNYHAENVKFYTPYINITKEDVLKDLEKNAHKLKLDVDEILKRTITSYKPILINDHYYSDYKSASSVSRVEAFIKMNKKDPIDYADETGPVSWEIVKSHVEAVLMQQS